MPLIIFQLASNECVAIECSPVLHPHPIEAKAIIKIAPQPLAAKTVKNKVLLVQFYQQSNQINRTNLI